MVKEADREPLSAILSEVADYYSGKLAEHGETPLGVDWNGEASQILRFEQLSKVIAPGHGFSVNDLGSGYGALFSYLDAHYAGVSYFGYDVSESMVMAARRKFGAAGNATFAVSSIPQTSADYGMASGIFNVRLAHADSEWRAYIEQTLDRLHETSRLGFSFNCLTSYSDADKMRSHLYYADPCTLFDLCKRKYSRQVALLHDYGLYEFTILVRKV